MQRDSQGHYEFAAVEKKWRHYWLDNATFKTPDFSDRPKYYVLDMFPYPSGNGLHVGHAEGYTATDIIARYKRMCGFNVLHPMGWDAFGLPAEQYAIKTGTHPRITTEKNINNFRRQIQDLGFSTDWQRELNTTDPRYYKWTQWIFLQLYNKGLAYESYESVNWCPTLGTVLANEEVIDGRSEVGGHPVEKRPIRQWVLKITAYAERLLADLEDLDWPESTKEMQRHWIGKSIGADVSFTVKDHPDKSFQVFTTRPDTLFGATFCVLAPEHPLVNLISTAAHADAVEAYREEAALKSELDRTAAGKDKSGVFTGAYAINPLNQKELPIYIADYVLANYGSGAIMAVPGHDERDHEFAKKYGLAIVEVISGGQQDIHETAYTGDGTLINSDFLNGLSVAAAKDKVCEWLSRHAVGQKAVTFKLRDWIFSRQRYWGEPFPIVHDEDGQAQALLASDLPVTLPDVDDYKPTGSTEPPLAKASDWVSFEKAGKRYLRETNIMPQWAGSCWYYLRFIDPQNDNAAWDPAKEKHWLPVDLYVGGVEHANLHLLYARFWHKVLFDLGLVSSNEPFKKLRHPGLVLGANGEKMSKSRGNVVNPDEVIAEWGSDALRLYEMFMGPLEQVKPWQMNGITGVHRFLKRIWRLLIDDEGQLTSKLGNKNTAESLEFRKLVHKTIKRVGEDTEELKFNTAIAAMMELLNAAYKEAALSSFSVESLVLMLAPYAPHMAEELWQRLGHAESLAYAPWPVFDPQLVEENQVIISVMVNGKLRATLAVATDIGEQDAIALAKEQPGVAKHLEGQVVRKQIFVPGKIVNFVVSKA